MVPDASLLSAEKERGRNAESKQRFEEQKDAERTRARKTGLGEEERPLSHDSCHSRRAFSPKPSKPAEPFRQRLVPPA